MIPARLLIVDRLAIAIQAATGARPFISPDGQLRRFDHPDKPRGNRRCWQICHEEVGIWGDWASGGYEVVFVDERPSAAQRDEARQRAQLIQQQRQHLREQQYAEAALRAQQQWQAASEAQVHHAYLQQKAIPPLGVRQCGRYLLVPITDGEQLCNVQRIYPDGRKRFMKGARITGGYCALGDMQGDGPVLICEGYATGVTLHTETGHPVACAMNAGNLLPVAQHLRHRFPERPLIVAADNDRFTPNNPGMQAARKAAIEVGARLMWPDFPCPYCECTDYNDLVQCSAAKGGE